MRRYTVILEYDPEAAAYSVTVPALPGCTSMGATVEEALANAQEAVVGHVAALEALGESVPEETTGPMLVVASGMSGQGDLKMLVVRLVTLAAMGALGSLYWRIVRRESRSHTDDETTSPTLAWQSANAS